MYYQYFLIITLGLICSVELRGSLVTSNPKLQPRIIGGEEVTDIAEFPFQVSVQYNGCHHCSGSFLSQRWVLTAAVCTHERSIYGLSIRAGSLQHTEGGVLIEVEKIEEHPQYDPRKDDYDFSLLRLASWYDDQIMFQPAQLPDQGEDIPDDTWLRVSGWGLDRNEYESSANLRAVYVLKLNQAKCNESYANYCGISDQMICAGSFEGGMGPCYGDSGAPLSWNGKLVGVASWVQTCGRPGFPGVYARVSSVRYWIYYVTDIWNL